VREPQRQTIGFSALRSGANTRSATSGLNERIPS
jgi:hypothetical protein